MRALSVSVSVHALLLLALVHIGVREQAPAHEAQTIEIIEVELPPIEPVKSAGGGGGNAAQPIVKPTARSVKSRSLSPAIAASNPWDEVSISEEVGGDGTGNGTGNGDGSGDGSGTGNGVGNGIGFGDGGGIAKPPAVPAPPKISLARPAKLLHPSRDREVDDEGKLFVAVVTVDEEGDVVGAHLIKSTPGRRAEVASSAIFSFRYAPALDDDGHPIKSTFEQPFQVW